MGAEILMGSIRPSNIKRIAEDLIEANPDAFTDDFANNREILKRSLDDVTKKTTNLIAGYITRTVIKKKAKLKREIEESGAS